MVAQRPGRVSGQGGLAAELLRFPVPVVRRPHATHFELTRRIGGTQILRQRTGRPLLSSSSRSLAMDDVRAAPISVGPREHATDIGITTAPDPIQIITSRPPCTRPDPRFAYFRLRTSPPWWDRVLRLQKHAVHLARRYLRPCSGAPHRPAATLRTGANKIHMPGGASPHPRPVATHWTRVDAYTHVTTPYCRWHGGSVEALALVAVRSHQGLVAMWVRAVGFGTVPEDSHRVRHAPRWPLSSAWAASFAANVRINDLTIAFNVC